MIELTKDETIAILIELNKLPYKDVQELIMVLSKKLIDITEAEDAETFRKELLGE